jgi:hypothetical protein
VDYFGNFRANTAHTLSCRARTRFFYAIHGVFSKVQKVLLEPKNILLHLINS